MNLVGAMYAAVMFLGGTNTSSVQSVVAVERTVFYREKAAGMYSALPYAFAQVRKTKILNKVTCLEEKLRFSFLFFCNKSNSKNHI